MSETNDKQVIDEVTRQMNKNWKILMFIGILTLILGIIGMGMNVTMTIVSILYIGFFTILGGILHLIDAFVVDGWKFVFRYLSRAGCSNFIKPRPMNN